MKRAMFVVVSLVIVLTWCTGVWAQEKTPPVAYAYRASEPISVDGDIAEWITLTPIVINDISQVIRDADHWLGPDGTSCVVYVMWDEDNLYLAADVTTTSRFDVIDGLPLDYVDNFMVYISTDPDLDPGRTAYDTRDFLLYLITDNNWWDTAFDRSMVEKRGRFSSAGMEGGENVLEGYEKAVQLTSRGFIYEAVIPWVNFSNNRIPVYTPQIGDVIKFNFAITDTIMACPGTEFVPQLAWTGDRRINTNPSLWGDLVFVDSGFVSEE